MADLKLNQLTPSAWTSTCSVVGSDSAAPTNSFLFNRAALDAVYGQGPGNPSASAGLSGINGSATTFMRSDGAPAISQAIVPTWTGQHTFSLISTLTAGLNIGGATSNDIRLNKQG